MKIHPLVSAAIDALEDVETSPTVQQLAVVLLLDALRERLVPGSSAAVGLVWRWVKRHPESHLWAGDLGSFADDAVRADAIDFLRHGDGAGDLIGIALGLLAGEGHASKIGDDLVMELVERFPDANVWAVRELVVAVNRTRGLTPSLLIAIRERWAASSSPIVREQAVALMFELADVDLALVAKMLDDPHADVRSAAAQRIVVNGEKARETIPLLEARLRIETHADARATLLRACAALEDAPRRFRR
jgi:hypothetical protein